MTGSFGVVDSFPKDFGYGGDEAGIDDDSSASADTQPRILLMGLRRSGKSSIQKVRWFTYTYSRVKTCTLRLLQKCVLFFCINACMGYACAHVLHLKVKQPYDRR